MFAYGQDNATNSTVTSNEESFKIYPNPATSDIVYITSAYQGNKQIVIYDVFGKVVLTDRIKLKSLDISKLVAGVYLLQVTENKKTTTRKLVVK